MRASLELHAPQKTRLEGKSFPSKKEKFGEKNSIKKARDNKHLKKLPQCREKTDDSINSILEKDHGERKLGIHTRDRSGKDYRSE